MVLHLSLQTLSDHVIPLQVWQGRPRLVDRGPDDSGGETVNTKTTSGAFVCSKAKATLEPNIQLVMFMVEYGICEIIRRLCIDLLNYMHKLRYRDLLQVLRVSREGCQRVSLRVAGLRTFTYKVFLEDIGREPSKASREEHTQVLRPNPLISFAQTHVLPHLLASGDLSCVANVGTKQNLPGSITIGSSRALYGES